MLCPKRKLRNASPAESKETEINSMVNDAAELKQNRSKKAIILQPNDVSSRCKHSTNIQIAVEGQ
ncbi:MAG: hypothetical protein R3C09_02190 [Pirellulaceae bacterium]|jgi:hypothetical protein